MAYRSILIVKLSAIGDVIHTLPVAHTLRLCYPEARIHWIVQRPAYGLLEGNPDIDEIIIFDKPRFKSLKGLVKYGPSLAQELKDRNFDLCLDLQGLFKSAAISFLSGASKRIGYCNMRELSSLVSKPICGENRNGHVVDRYLDTVRALGCEVQEVIFPVVVSDCEAASANALMASAGLQSDQPYILLAPGTNWKTKCWPTAHFGQLAKKLYERRLTPVVIGSSADIPLAEDIAFRAGAPIINITGRTSLKELAYIIRNAAAFIGGDTGTMHLAAAVGTPVVALFGPTDSRRNGPYGHKNRIIEVDRSCKGCWKRSCDKNCLERIAPDEVLASVEQLL